jgi:hypothetical protein
LLSLKRRKLLTKISKKIEDPDEVLKSAFYPKVSATGADHSEIGKSFHPERSCYPSTVGPPYGAGRAGVVNRTGS